MKKYNEYENNGIYEDNTMESGCDLSNYMKKIGKYPVLTRDEEVILFKRIENGDFNAKNELVEHNLKLVAHMAKKYIGRGVDYDDLIQEGSFGLFDAIEGFDYTRGNKFSTYATYWIKKRISEYIRDNGRPVRLTSNMIDEISHLNRAESMLEEKYERKPTDTELASELNKTTDKVREIIKFRQDAFSFNKAIGEDGQDTLRDIYEDPTAEKLEDSVMKNFYKDDIAKAFDVLNELEKKVIISLFGLDSGEPMTIDMLAKEFNINREGIHTIKLKAMRKIRNQLGNDYLAA